MSCCKSTALLKVDFGSQSQSRVPDFYSTFVKNLTLNSTLLDFKSGKSDLDSSPLRRSTPSPKPYAKVKIICDIYGEHKPIFYTMSDIFCTVQYQPRKDSDH